MTFLRAAISAFRSRPRIRRLWFRLFRHFLGVGLRWKLIPASYRNVCGNLCDWISFGYLSKSQRGFDNSLVIETASICNASCSFCPYPILDFPKKLMPSPVFDKAVKVAGTMKAEFVDFTPYLGEAFVDPQFLSRVRSARRELPDAVFYLTTNGTLLTRFDMNDVLTSGLSRINVSFGTWGREDYLKLYNIDAWDKVFAGIQRLLEAKERLKANVFIALWYRSLDVRRLNNPENLAFLERFKHQIDEVIYTDVFHDILSISGQQPAHIRRERQFDSSSVKESPCARLGKLACSSTGNWFCCYCVASDCYKQEKSWFYLGSERDPALDLNQAVAQKVSEWKAGKMPETCRTCPVYVPTRENGSDTIHAPAARSRRVPADVQLVSEGKQF